MTTSAPSRRLKWPTILNCAIAVVSAATSVALAFAVYRLWSADPALLLFLSAVIFVALAAGPGPAALAFALTLLPLLYFFLSPSHSFALKFSEIFQLALFVMAAVFVVSLSAAHRKASSLLRLARDEQQKTAKELQELNERLRVNYSEHEQVEETLRTFRLIVDSIPVPVAVTTPDGEVQALNQPTLDYFGKTLEELTGWKVSDVVHPDDLQYTIARQREAHQVGRAYNVESRYRRADGLYRWFNVLGLPLRDSQGHILRWFHLQIDIDDWKQAETALRQSEAELKKARQELQLTIDTIPAIVVVFDPDGKPYYANRRAKEYLGCDFPTDNPRDSVHPDDRAMIDELWSTHLASPKPFQIELRARRAADGQYRWHFTRREPLFDEAGKAVRWYGTSYDIEDRKQAESELIESERRFRETQMELAHASRVVTMGQLTASIAHEVNQPITATIGNAEAALRWLAHQPPNLEETRQLLARIAKDGRRASNVVDRIRDLTKKAPPRIEPIEINGAIAEVVELTRGEATKNGVSVQTQLAEGLPFVEADRIQVQQVTLNLIVNAVQALGESLKDPRELSISTSMDGTDGVTVSVRDSGPGLNPENLGRLFDPFYTTKPDGMGMGLSICQSIIESHRGRIWATANVPRGAAFHFTIPMARQGF